MGITYSGTPLQAFQRTAAACVCAILKRTSLKFERYAYIFSYFALEPRADAS